MGSSRPAGCQPRSRYVRAVRLPSSGGIVPLSSLLLRLRLVSAMRFPNSAGTVPFSWFPPRSSLRQCGEVPQFRWNRPTQILVSEVEFNDATALIRS